MTGPPEDRRRPVLRSEEFNSSPRYLRANIKKLDKLLEGSDAWMRRRVQLMFGDLISNWQESFAGEPISLSLELLPGAARLSIGNAERTLTYLEWDRLMTPSITDLVDAWGSDRRVIGQRWFEFREHGVRTEGRLTGLGARK
jgi:hypothetical protein